MSTSRLHIAAICLIGMITSANALESKVYLTNDSDSVLNVQLAESPSTSIMLLPYTTQQIFAVQRDDLTKIKEVQKYHLAIASDKFPHQPLVYEIAKYHELLSSKLMHWLKLPDESEQPLFVNPHEVTKIQTGWNDNYQLFAKEKLTLGHVYDDQFLVVHQTVEPYSLKAEQANELSVLNYNTQLLPFYTGVVDKLNQPGIRAQLIPYRIPEDDVVVFEELFDKAHRVMVKILMENRGYEYHTEVIGEGTHNVLTGGVMIFSKWPIENTDAVVYPNCHGVDCLADKGVAYVDINKLGKHYHLFATHLQADDDDASVKVRSQQLQTIHDFITSHGISPTEPVLLAGDLNIDLFSPEYQHLTAHLPVLLPDNSGYPYSYDGNVNQMAISKVAQRLDYVFALKGYAQPTSMKSHVLVLREMEAEALWPNVELSDHFPLEAVFTFDTKDTSL